MTCSEFLERFSEYVDGTGSSDLRAEVEGHLAECPDCTRYREVFERGTELLRSFPEVEVSDDFRPRLQHRIYHIEDGETLSTATSGSAATGLTALGMAVLLVFAAWSPVVLQRDAVVDVRPIVVSTPAPRALGIRPAGSPEVVDPGSPLSDDERRWQANALLFQYSPLAERAGRARVRRAGLD